MKIFKWLMIIFTYISIIIIFIFNLTVSSSYWLYLIFITLVLIGNLVIAIYFPLNKYKQEKEINKMRYRYDEVIKRLHEVTDSLCEKIITKVIDDILKDEKNDFKR